MQHIKRGLIGVGVYAITLFMVVVFTFVPILAKWSDMIVIGSRSRFFISHVELVALRGMYLKVGYHYETPYITAASAPAYVYLIPAAVSVIFFSSLYVKDHWGSILGYIKSKSSRARISKLEQELEELKKEKESS